MQYADSKEIESALPEKSPPKPMPMEFSGIFENIDEGELLRKHILISYAERCYAQNREIIL